MGVSLKNPQDGGIPEISDINVTPFIDVILVLLIIFMVAAPLSTVDVAVDLPTANTKAQPRPDKPVYLTVKKDLMLVLEESGVARDMLKPAIDRLTGGDREQRIFLRADGGVAYRELMEVMNLLRKAGYLRIALVGLEATGGTAAAGAPVQTP